MRPEIGLPERRYKCEKIDERCDDDGAERIARHKPKRYGDERSYEAQPIAFRYTLFSPMQGDCGNDKACQYAEAQRPSPRPRPFYDLRGKDDGVEYSVRQPRKYVRFRDTAENAAEIKCVADYSERDRSGADEHLIVVAHD